MSNVLSGKAMENMKVFLGKTAAQAGEDPRLRRFILDWALDPELGSLPGMSGRAFTNWLDICWEDWAADPEATVKSVLEGAVSDWCGGRTF